MSNLEQPIFIIAGMHRSGTSLIASLLQSAGINLGQRLLQGDLGNVKGYFENLDFLAFHQNLFADLGINKVGWTLEDNIAIPKVYVCQAQELIQKSASSTQPWGWKDPRTTLLLNFWANLLPQAKFIFVYRAPWEVLDSLYRRGDEFFQQNPELALKMWRVYNQKILNFYNGFSDRCLLVNLNRVTVNPEGLIEMIGQKWGISLISPDVEIYDHSLLHRQTSKSHYPTIIKDYFPEAFELYTQLNQTTGDQKAFIDELTPSQSVGVFLLQEWLAGRILEKEHKQSTLEIENLQQANTWLESQYHLWKQEAQNTQQAWEQSQEWIKKLEEAKDWLASQVQQGHQAWQKSQDWIKKLEKDIDLFKKTVEETSLELEKAQGYIQQLNQQQQETYRELEKAQGHIQQLNQQQQETYRELEKAQRHIQHLDQLLQELQQQKASLESEKAELEVQFHLWQQKAQENQQELEQTRILIEAMESSKFWKLRNTWFKLKQAVQPN